MNKLALVGVALILGATSAIGQPIILGLGGQPGSCGEWARSPSGSGYDLVYNAWVLGYLSSFNVWSETAKNITGAISNDSVLDWVKLWCQNHPLDQVATAAGAAIYELSVRRQAFPDQFPARRQ
jgi:hypothetical protein